MLTFRNRLAVLLLTGTLSGLAFGYTGTFTGHARPLTQQAGGGSNQNCLTPSHDCKLDWNHRQEYDYNFSGCPTAVQVPNFILRWLAGTLEDQRSCSGPYALWVRAYSCQGAMSHPSGTVTVVRPSSSNLCDIGNLLWTPAGSGFYQYISACDIDRQDLSDAFLVLQLPAGILRYEIELVCCSCCACTPPTPEPPGACPPETDWTDWYPYDRVPGNEGERARDPWNHGQSTTTGGSFGRSSWDIPDPLAPLPRNYPLGSPAGSQNIAWFWLCEDQNRPDCPFFPATGPREIDAITDGGQSNGRWGLTMNGGHTIEMYVDISKMHLNGSPTECIRCTPEDVGHYFDQHPEMLTDAAVDNPQNPFMTLDFRLPGTEGVGGHATGRGACRIFFNEPFGTPMRTDGRLALTVTNLISVTNANDVHQTGQEFIRTTLIANESDPPQQCNVKDLVNDFITNNPYVCAGIRQYCLHAPPGDRRCNGNQPRLVTLTPEEMQQLYGSSDPCHRQSVVCEWCIQDYEVYRLRRRTNTVNGGIFAYSWNGGTFCAYDTCVQSVIQQNYQPSPPNAPTPTATAGDPSNETQNPCPSTDGPPDFEGWALCHRAVPVEDSSPGCCPTLDAHGVGPCDVILGYIWSGCRCVMVSGCTCEGADCDKLIPRCTSTY